jgi:parvulin-like peptidyl-prolyl isomerase
VVDGTEIKVAEVEKALGTVLAQQGATIEQVPAEMKPQLYRQVLDGVIVEKLVTRESAKVEITDADVAKEFERFKGQFPNEEAMKAQLAKAGQTLEAIQGDIRRFLQQNRWLDDQVKGKTDVTDGEAQEFYKTNTDKFKTPEQVRASHILVKCEKDAKEDEVKTKREAANKVLDRVKKGEDFDKLAGELSEDPSAKENKGDLNFFGREQMVPEFSTAAFAMKKGEVSEAPVRSEFGFHIIKVTDRKEGGTVAFDEAKPKLLAYLQQQKRQTEAGKILRTLREGAKVTVNLPEAPAAPADPPAALK